MPPTSTNESATAKREDALWLASEKYMKGTMSVEELEEVERKYAPNLFKKIKKTSFQQLLEAITFKLFG